MSLQLACDLIWRRPFLERGYVPHFLGIRPTKRPQLLTCVRAQIREAYFAPTSGSPLGHQPGARSRPPHGSDGIFRNKDELWTPIGRGVYRRQATLRCVASLAGLRMHCALRGRHAVVWKGISAGVAPPAKTRRSNCRRAPPFQTSRDPRRPWTRPQPNWARRRMNERGPIDNPQGRYTSLPSLRTSHSHTAGR